MTGARSSAPNQTSATFTGAIYVWRDLFLRLYGNFYERVLRFGELFRFRVGAMLTPIYSILKICKKAGFYFTLSANFDCQVSQSQNWTHYCARQCGIEEFRESREVEPAPVQEAELSFVSKFAYAKL